MLSKKSEALADVVWQDREIRFDFEPRQLRLGPGEHVIDRIDSVEDTKGNCGDKGTMKVTNLRVLWYAQNMVRVNLSIGFNTINGLRTKFLETKMHGHAECLYVIARNESTRFEFIFTCIRSSQAKMFKPVVAIHRAYETSKTYRELKMRGPLLSEDGQLRILPGEQQYDQIDGVWNLSGDQGTLGQMILTNIRITWHAVINPSYNVSIPYLHLCSCNKRRSKFGIALVIETSVASRAYIIGFRIDPENKLEEICKTIQALNTNFNSKPIFGIHYNRERPGSSQGVGEAMKLVDEDIELDERPLRLDAYAAYFRDGLGRKSVRPPVYSEELGVAVEELKEGFTISDLWNIHIE